MIFPKSFSLFFTVVLGLIVICESLDDIRARSHSEVNTRGRQRYIYHHPPPEEYQSIPVAVVFDGNGPQDEKLSDVSKEKSDVLQTKEQSTQKDMNLRKVSEEETVKVVEKLLVNEPQKGFPEKEQQIPVAIVYEPVQVIRKKMNKTRRVQRRRKRPQEKNIKISENTTDAQIVTTIEPIVVTNAYKYYQGAQNKEVTSTRKSDDIKSGLKIKSTTDGRKRVRDPVVPIIEMENQIFSHTGEFHYSYEGGDGTKAFENGEIKTFDDDTSGASVAGGFTYKDKDGKDVSLSYTADENGYRPIGDHLPTPPPIPPAIARALQYLATKTTPEPVTEPFTDDDKR